MTLMNLYVNFKEKKYDEEIQNKRDITSKNKQVNPNSHAAEQERESDKKN